MNISTDVLDAQTLDTGKDILLLRSERAQYCLCKT